MQLILDQARDLVGASNRRRHAESFDDRAPQLSVVDAAGVEPPGERDLRDGMNRIEGVAQRHALAGAFGVHLHILEAAEAEQVRDALAHVDHRQRTPVRVSTTASSFGSVAARPSMSSRTDATGRPM